MPKSKNARKNWTMIRVRRSTKKLLEEEAALMRRNYEWAANRDEIHITEAGRHKDIVSLDTVIRTLIAYRKKHRQRRDDSARARKSSKGEPLAAQEASPNGGVPCYHGLPAIDSGSDPTAMLPSVDLGAV